MSAVFSANLMCPTRNTQNRLAIPFFRGFPDRLPRNRFAHCDLSTRERVIHIDGLCFQRPRALRIGVNSCPLLPCSLSCSRYTPPALDTARRRCRPSLRRAEPLCSCKCADLGEARIRLFTRFGSGRPAQLVPSASGVSSARRVPQRLTSCLSSRSHDARGGRRNGWGSVKVRRAPNWSFHAARSRATTQSAPGSSDRTIGQVRRSPRRARDVSSPVSTLSCRDALP